MNPPDDGAIHADRCVGGTAFRFRPVTSTVALVDDGRVEADVMPFESDQFAVRSPE
jgi:hypothetical protein